MRNGDYVPTRLDAQQDAGRSLVLKCFLFTIRSQHYLQRAHRISPGKYSWCAINGRKRVIWIISSFLLLILCSVEVLVSPTEDIGKILAAFARVSNNGTCDFSSSIQIAQLALKHRKNKVGGQRIIVFVGSPVKDEVKALQKLGKQLKKNNIAVDVVLMGEISDNQEKLGEFVNAANSNDDRCVLGSISYVV